MTRLLHLKHWQLFLLLFGIPFLIEMIAAGSIILSGEPTTVMIIFPVLMFLFVAVYFGWLYTLGAQLHKKLPSSTPVNLTRFKIFFWIPIVYITTIIAFISLTMSNPETMEVPNPGIMALIIPLHLFSMFCIFYCLYFVAKELKSVEMQRPVTFSDFAGEFFLLWFYPIGVWILQPRINRLFDEGVQPGDHLFSSTPMQP